MNNLVAGVAAVMVDMDDHRHDDGEAAAAAAAAATAAPLNVHTALVRQPKEDRPMGAILPATKLVATIRQRKCQP